MTNAGTAPRELEGRIVDAARDLMADGGIDALSMRAVAERVGVSATALYRYFDGKQALVDRVVHAAFARFGAYLEDAMARHPVGSLERVRALGEAYVSFALENREYFRVIFSIQFADPRELDDLPGGGGYHLLRQSVVDAMAQGTMRPADPDLVSLYVWSMVHGLVTLVLACKVEACLECESPHASPLELFRAFGPFVREGLVAPHARTDGSDGRGFPAARSDDHGSDDMEQDPDE